MKKISNTEVRKREIKLLNYVKEICIKNNLKYYLYAGSLAGAFYYEGFLPNDDDIDIVLSRPDYEKLIRILDKDDKYKLLTPYNNTNYYYPFAKLVDNKTKIVENSRLKIEDLGIYIDIFPMDGLPKYLKKIYLFKMRIYKNLLLTKMVDKPTVKKLKHIYFLLKYYIIICIDHIFKNKDDNYFAIIIDKKAKKYNYDNSKYISLVSYGNRNNNYVLKDYFLKQKQYKFCNDYYTSIEDAPYLLNKIYAGKIHKYKHSKHNFVAFFK